MKKHRILLLDDHAIFRQGIGRLLAAEPDLELAHHCASVSEALGAVCEGSVDLVVLDVNLGRERGIDFLRQARNLGFQGPVIILTAGLSADEEDLLRREGICGVLGKEDPMEVLSEMIRDCLGIPQRPLSLTRGESDPHLLPKLSPRESEVLRGVVEGLLNKEIAGELGYTEPTIKAIIRKLFRKTGAQTRSQLVRVALEVYAGQF